MVARLISFARKFGDHAHRCADERDEDRRYPITCAVSGASISRMDTFRTPEPNFGPEKDDCRPMGAGTAVALRNGMDIKRENAKRNRWLRRGLLLTILLVVSALVTLGLSRLEPAAPTSCLISRVTNFRRSSRVRSLCRAFEIRSRVWLLRSSRFSRVMSVRVTT